MYSTIDSNRPKNRLAAWAERRPGLFALAVMASIVVLSTLTQLLMAPLNGKLSPDVLNTLASVIVSALFAGLTTAMGWWQETGFRAPHQLGVVWLPAIIVASMYGGLNVTSVSGVLLLAVAALSTGFLEEIIFRGLLLRAFLPGGAVRAAVISSLLFGSMHLLNLLDGAPLDETLIQIGIAFMTGIFMAGLTLKTGSIWPGILYHMMHDFVVWMGQGGIQMPQEPSTTWKVIMLSGQFILFVYGVILLRGGRPTREVSR